MAQNAVGDFVRRAIAAHSDEVAVTFGNGLFCQFGGVHFPLGKNGVEVNASSPELCLDFWPMLGHCAATTHRVDDETPLFGGIIVLIGHNQLML